MSCRKKSRARRREAWKCRRGHCPCGCGRHLPGTKPQVASAGHSRCPRSRVFRNIPSGEPDESFPEEIRVLDPQHPLYGKSVRVIRRSPRRSGNFLPSYEVEYRNGITLLVPVATTQQSASLDFATKLSMDALHDPLNMVNFIDHEHGARKPLDDNATDATATDRRRYRRSSGGGLP